jgi:hypothetical protein
MNGNLLAMASFNVSVFVVSIALSIAIVSPPVRAQTVTFEPRNKGSVDDSRGGTSRVLMAKYQFDEMVEPEQLNK